MFEENQGEYRNNNGMTGPVKTDGGPEARSVDLGMGPSLIKGHPHENIPYPLNDSSPPREGRECCPK
jgi:hypothetical protein